MLCGIKFTNWGDPLNSIFSIYSLNTYCRKLAGKEKGSKFMRYLRFEDKE